MAKITTFEKLNRKVYNNIFINFKNVYWKIN